MKIICICQLSNSDELWLMKTFSLSFSDTQNFQYVDGNRFVRRNFFRLLVSIMTSKLARILSVVCRKRVGAFSYLSDNFSFNFFLTCQHRVASEMPLRPTKTKSMADCQKHNCYSLNDILYGLKEYTFYILRTRLTNSNTPGVQINKNKNGTFKTHKHEK